MENQKGITLVALVTTIVLMMILTSVATYTGVEVLNNVRIQNFLAKMRVIQEKVDLIYDNYKNWEGYGEGSTINGSGGYISETLGMSHISTSVGEDYTIFKTILENDIADLLNDADQAIGNYFYFTPTDLEQKLGLKDLDITVIINFATRNVVEKEGVRLKGEDGKITRVYRQYDLPGGQKLQGKNSTDTPSNRLECKVIENNGLSKKIQLTLINTEKEEDSIATSCVREVYYQNTEITNDKWKDATRLLNYVYNENSQTITFDITTSGKYNFKVIDSSKIETSIMNELDIVLVNAPKLANGMKATYWNEANIQVTEGESGFDWAKWYDYGNKKWANAVTKNNSGTITGYWVWIPRYEYKITYYTNSSYTTISSTKTLYGKIDIRFLEQISSTSTDKVSEKGYKVHPAFKNGSSTGYVNGEWDKDLEGIWVAKFEASYSSDVIVIPNTPSKRTITPQNAFTYCRAMETKNIYGFSNLASGTLTNGVYSTDYNDIDTHLMKNSEWGAVSYLAYSKYGNTAISKNTNSSYYTGGGTTLNDVYVINKNQSTTANAFGIYDLVGCSNEMVAAGINISIFQSANTSTKYATKYASTEASNSIYGDAVLWTSGWNSNTKVYPTSGSPLFVRGGGQPTSSGFGLFYYSNITTTNSTAEYGFRPVLIVE